MTRKKSARERSGEDEPSMFLQTLETCAPGIGSRRKTLAGDGDEATASEKPRQAGANMFEGRRGVPSLDQRR